MDIQSLIILKTAADTGSFSAAARELNFAQSHISTQIQNLEHEVGAPLFYRHNRGISLTPKGEIFIGFANEMNRIMTEAKLAISESDEPSGTLRISSMQTSAQTLLPSLLSNYHRLYPRVRLEIRTGTSSKNVQDILNYEADIAFVAGDFKNSVLASKKIAEEKLVLLGADLPERIDSVSDLENRTLLVFTEGCSYRRRLENWFASEGFPIEDMIVFDSIAGIMAAACAGLGSALLPERAVKALKDQDLLTTCEIPEQFSRISLRAVYRKDQYISSALNKMLSLL